MDTAQQIERYLRSLHDALTLVDSEAIDHVIRYLSEVREQNGTVWIIGNGGSAATASHFANDLRKMAILSAISLPDMTPIITAYGNDAGWINMFSHPLMGFMKENDCLVAISCSGRSPNILEAVSQVEPNQRIILTGEPGPRNILALAPSVEILYVQSPDIKVQEDVHLAFCHMIANGLIGND